MDPSVDTVSFGESEPAGKREADAGRDHWCSPRVDGLDDLVGVDALQVDRGDAEVAVAEFALDDVERHAFVSEFDAVGVAELVRGKAPAYTGTGGESAQHRASRRGLPGAPAGGAVDDAEQGPTGMVRRTVSQGSSCSKPQSSMPTSRRRPPLPRRTRT